LTALVVSDVIFGVVGLILAIPLVLYLRHELEHIPGLSPAHKADPGHAIARLTEKRKTQ